MTGQKEQTVINIEITTEAHEFLRGVQTQLQKILHKKKVTFSQVILVLKAVTRLDDTLIQMQLEET
jgi:hypothetical protein